MVYALGLLNRVMNIPCPFPHMEIQFHINSLPLRTKYWVLNFTTDQSSVNFPNWSQISQQDPKYRLTVHQSSARMGKYLHKLLYPFFTNKELDLRKGILNTKFDNSGHEADWAVPYLTESTSLFILQ